jgi:hypothetical protein
LIALFDEYRRSGVLLVSVARKKRFDWLCEV